MSDALPPPGMLNEAQAAERLGLPGHWLRAVAHLGWIDAELHGNAFSFSAEALAALRPRIPELQQRAQDELVASAQRLGLGYK